MLSKAVDRLQTREEQLQSIEAQEESSGRESLLHIALLSTVVFHGAWQKQFLFTETQNLPFTLSDGSTVKVPMMYQSTEVNFGKGRTKTDTAQLTFPCGVLMGCPLGNSNGDQRNLSIGSTCMLAHRDT